MFNMCKVIKFYYNFITQTFVDKNNIDFSHIGTYINL